MLNLTPQGREFPTWIRALQGCGYLGGRPQRVLDLELAAQLHPRTAHVLHFQKALLRVHHRVVPTSGNSDAVSAGLPPEGRPGAALEESISCGSGLPLPAQRPILHVLRGSRLRQSLVLPAWWWGNDSPLSVIFDGSNSCMKGHQEVVHKPQSLPASSLGMSSPRPQQNTAGPLETR